VQQRPQTSDLAQTYQYCRRRYKQGWGLAWYLAGELNDRFYSSHGIRPEVIEHEGLGYYGIALQQLSCRIVREPKTLGRCTAAGNVENWITGSPGDHGLELVKRADEGESPDELLRNAIRYLNLPILPAAGHHLCRHKRWGGSAVLVFHLAALVAMRWDEKVQIWNNPARVFRLAAQLDPHSDMSEHPGHLIIANGRHEVLLAADGRILKPAVGDSLWESYMSGQSKFALLRVLETWLGLA
jgi:hypothetical protein